MTLIDSLKIALDSVRGIPGILGLRQIQVSVRVTTWSGTRIGSGTPTVVHTPLKVNGQNPSVKQVSQKDIIASGGLYQAQDVEVVITPEFSVGGFALADINPPTSSSPKEVHYILSGPSYPTPAVFKSVGQTTTENLTYKLVLRKEGAR